MFRDENVFPEPHKFYPERYLNPVDEATSRRMDPRGAVFGFGRRYVAAPSCDGEDSPGVHFAGNALVRTWLNRQCG